MRCEVLGALLLALSIVGCNEVVHPHNTNTVTPIEPAAPRVEDIPGRGWNEFIWKRHAQFTHSEIRATLHESLLTLESVERGTAAEREATLQLYYAARLARLENARSGRHLLTRALPVVRGHVNLEVGRAIAKLSQTDEEVAETLSLFESSDDYLRAGILLEMGEEWCDHKLIADALNPASMDRDSVLVATVRTLVVEFRRVRELFDRFDELPEGQRRRVTQVIIRSWMFRLPLNLKSAFPGKKKAWVPNDHPMGVWAMSAYETVRRERPELLDAVWGELFDEDPGYEKARAALEGEAGEGG